MCKVLEASVEISREEWEKIQASFTIDFRLVDENNDPLSKGSYDPYLGDEADTKESAELIQKYDFRCATNPNTFVFEFEDGTKIFCDWYIEEFGGVIRWGDEDCELCEEHEYELEQFTTFESFDKHTGNVDKKYICFFSIID